MSKDAQPLSKITKVVHKKLDTYKMSLMAIEGEAYVSNVIKAIILEMNLQMYVPQIDHLIAAVSDLLWSLAEWECNRSDSARKKILSIAQNITFFAMKVSENKHPNDYVLFLRGFLIHIYPYILGEKELFVGLCPNCGKVFYKNNRKKVFCTYTCSSTCRSRRYRKRIREKAIEANS